MLVISEQHFSEMIGKCSVRSLVALSFEMQSHGAGEKLGSAEIFER